MDDKVKIGISSCLLGNGVRYDGANKLDHNLRITLGRFVEWVPVCPEVEAGLPVPREAMHLVGDPAAPRLVTKFTGVDHGNRVAGWAKKKFFHLEKAGICGFVFKARSPSCGLEDVKIHCQSGRAHGKGAGIFAKAFMDHFPSLPVEDEEGMRNAVIRENFVERIFVYQRWREFKTQDGTTEGLVRFHASHKLLMMSHSIRHLRELGAIIVYGKKLKRSILFARYEQALIAGMRLPGTVKKHTKVLQHLAGCFKKQLNRGDKKELQESILRYHGGLVPLIVPVTLIRHYAGKYNLPYLKYQCYLNPHPLELMLKNHV
ncbi:MAG TPA: DUF523 and DUF1722 domain-containing protein [Nitrospirota bacterium]|nr:DUF523 and DUF1722 domain-containing protein [Nitrospirota bacterium]